MYTWIYFLLATLSLFGAPKQEAFAWQKTTYLFSNEPIDVVIPCASKDLESLELCIRGIKEHGKDIRRIIVVSKKKLTDSAEWFDETLYPFSKEDVALEIFKGDAQAAANFLSSPDSRIGWIFQQFLKLYASLTIPGISSNILVLDADVIFLKPTRFMSDLGQPLFATAHERHMPYLDHMRRLLPGLSRVFPHDSGVTHHMLFQKPILEDLFRHISLQHQAEPWRAICRCIDLNEINLSSFSEYEIYFNFTFRRTDQSILRPLRWVNISHLSLIERYRPLGYSFITFHSWGR